MLQYARPVLQLFYQINPCYYGVQPPPLPPPPNNPLGGRRLVWVLCFFVHSLRPRLLLKSRFKQVRHTQEPTDPKCMGRLAVGGGGGGREEEVMRTRGSDKAGKRRLPREMDTSGADDVTDQHGKCILDRYLIALYCALPFDMMFQAKSKINKKTYTTQ